MTDDQDVAALSDGTIEGRLSGGEQPKAAVTGLDVGSDGRISMLIAKAGEPRMAHCEMGDHDFGPVTPIVWRGQTVMPRICDECAQRITDAEAARRAAADLTRMNLPSRIDYREASLDRFRVTTNTQRAALDAVSGMAADWRFSGRLPGGLLLVGPTGVGKTYLGVCLTMELGADDALFLPAHELLDGLRASYEGGESHAARAASVPYLVLDDISGVRVTEWVEDRLYAILNSRWNQGLPLMATSNMEPGELAGRLGAGITSRLVGMCGRVILMDGPDGRLTQGGTP